MGNVTGLCYNLDMSLIVYYLSLDPGGQDLFPMSERFSDDELLPALTRVEQLRKLGKEHVCISSQLGNSIGKPGVSAVVDGKTPDGHAYEWSKQHRGGQRL